MKKRNIRRCVIGILALLLLGLISSRYFFRIDLTTEKRYTLSDETKHILRQLDAPLYLDIYLDGEMPAEFRRLKNNVREILDDFKSYSRDRLSYHFINPSDAVDTKDREHFYQELEKIGLRKTSVNITNKDGNLSQQTIFPGTVISYKDRMVAVNLLSDNRVLSPDVILNASIESLEYELIKAIHLLSVDSIGKIAFIIGHGELSRAETYDFAFECANSHDVDRKIIDGQIDALDDYKAIIIAKPQKAFEEKDKYIIDQYIMRGGKVMWLMDAVDVNTDSLFSIGYTFALASQLNLEDQLFNYGVRVNPYLIQDVNNNGIPVTLADGSSQPTPAPWLYYPVVTPSANHVITRYLNPVWLRYANDIDTVGSSSDITKTVLLQSSQISRIKTAPFMIYLDEVTQIIDKKQFNKPHRITAVLLEGKFPSLYRSRNAKSLFPDLDKKQITSSVETKMIVVSDGDIARNDVRNTPQGQVASTNPLGYDRYSRHPFGNKDFLVNAVDYLTDDAGLMKLRNREFQLRLLNKQKVAKEQVKWQIINVVLPVILIICGGILYGRWRKYKYGRIIGR
ncbi:MAG: gliding motility-associated ABC transporter substrate-binding protein GldG [Bacteroidales bacterium]|jgi:ABC-2 type transport system permease protein|nr:gliding motility-associated ABC transporter substrate-binding protein GldG [Bacteroidales bacterium]